LHKVLAGERLVIIIIEQDGGVEEVKGKSKRKEVPNWGHKVNRKRSITTTLRKMRKKYYSFRRQARNLKGSQKESRYSSNE